MPKQIENGEIILNCCSDMKELALDFIFHKLEGSIAP